MSDARDRGITVTEIAAMDEPIAVSPETTAAFIGRALRGPLHTPVLVRHFGEFRRRFGDCWSRSSLGPAVKQFFEHGGRKLYVVRVANTARGAMLCLPADGSALLLRAVDPGSTERLRAAVDYDGIPEDNDRLFNLTVQRVDPTSGLVVDQEMFKRLSYVEGDETFVADMLLTSTIVRVEAPFPLHRPAATTDEDSRFELTWVDPVQEGTDGTELSDYDLVGSMRDGTGLFALQQAERVDIVYLPPPGKGRDTGPAAILAADQYCKRRGAMLVVDPATAWQTADDAVAGVRELGYASPNILSYFPRLCSRGNDGPPRVAGGALAGLLCKLDATAGPWEALDRDLLGFKRRLRPAVDLDQRDTRALARAGLNAIVNAEHGRARVVGAATLSRGSESNRMFRSLPVRRTCLAIVSSVDLATRWAVFEQPDRKLTARIRAQVLAYLSGLANVGAFENDRFMVDCDAGLCERDDRLEHGVTILLVFQPKGSRVPISFTIHQTVAGCRVTSTAFAPVIEDCA
ncbi:MAG: hypothetical protein QNJ00_11520 [Woeseiaceae bacterium]|nr:hypothetical protein [Woeseiaceae bacterium]